MSEREEFEAWLSRQPDFVTDALRRRSDGSYASAYTLGAWAAWNARPTPDGDAVRVPRGYNLSRDYKRLFQFLLANGKAAGFLRTGDFYDGDVVGISRPKPWTVLIGVRGHSFANVYPFNEEDGRTEEDEFIRACEFAKLEWIEPIAAPSAHCGDREAWRPIETAPKDGTRALLWADEWSAPATGQWYGKDWRQLYDLGAFKFQPTHWMPLPHAPEISAAIAAGRREG
jgi:hypothetical protein